MHIISKFNRVNSLKTTKDVQSMLVLINVNVIDLAILVFGSVKLLCEAVFYFLNLIYIFYPRFSS